MIEILKSILGKSFESCGYDKDIKVIISNRPDLCDYQCDDAFKMAKKYNISPIEIGTKVVENLLNSNNFEMYFKKVEFVKPGFINITLSDNIINNFINEMFTKNNYNISTEKQETFFLDYGGPNVAKPLHVGHLRTAIIGESIKRIINFMGHKTVADVHLGDYGLQIGQVIYGIINDNISLDELTIEYLEETYPKMSKLCKEDEELLNKCALITKQLQEGNEQYINMWKKICSISTPDIKRMYNYLGVSFDLWEGESDCYQYIEKVTQLLNEKNLLTESEGAKIIDISEPTDNKEMPPLIYQKSNGAYLYGTTDMAAIYQRVTKYNPDHILYVVDARQSLHFEQVFRACNKIGLTNNINLQHLGYGTVNGSDGKPFKTRSGSTAKLDDLFKQVKEVFINTKESNQNMKEEDLDKIVNAIIKFADLQNNREKDYIFDIVKFSNVVGKTGPYILYTYLRMNKILQNEELKINNLNNLVYNDVDRQLRVKLIQLEQSINIAFNEKMPNYVSEYIYDLCVCCNVFYQNNHIVGLEDNQKQQWLLLISYTNKLIKDLLKLLMVEIPSEM